MTTVKISQLPAITGADAATTDVLPIVDVSGNVTNKITREEFFKNIASVDINGGTIDGAVIGGSSAAAGTFTTVTASGDLTIADKIVHSGDTNTAIRFPAADTVTVETSGAERLRVDSSGNVGVGTASPSDYNAAADNLVVGTTSGNNGITIASGTANQGSLFFADGTSSGAEEAAGYLVYEHTSNYMAFGTSNSERMRITSGGNVGIGVSSPTSKLMVAGNILAPWNNTGTYEIGVAQIDSNVFSTSSNVFVVRGADAIAGGNAMAGGSVLIRGGSAFGTAAGSAGNVTIQGGSGEGGASATPGIIAFNTGNPPTERMRIDSSGNVGIGGSPSVLLHARSDTAQIRASNAANSIYSYMLRNGLYSVGTQMYVYNVSNSPISFYTNDTERMRIDASGNLGLGVTPSAWGSSYRALQIERGALVQSSGFTVLANNFVDDGAAKYIVSDFSSAYVQVSGQHRWSTAPSGTAGNAITFTQAMTLDASGNLGLGTTTFSQPSGIRDFVVSREVTNEGSRVLAKGGPSGFTSYIAINSGSHDNSSTHYSPSLMYTSALRFFSAPIDQEPNDANLTERARIDASGNLLVGTTAAAYAVGEKVSVINTSGNNGVGIAIGNTNNVGLGIYSGYTATGTATAIQFQDHNSIVRGSITVTTSSTAYNTSSDYRLKENVAPMQNALDTVAQLNPVTYTWKADGSAGQGFIAHELQAVVPDCVTGEKDAVDAEGNPQYQGVDTSFLVATLVKAIQELKAEVDSLRAQLNP